jgi:hypothetical protein
MRHFRQRLKNGARCRREIVGDWHLFSELNWLVSANQNDGTKRQSHIADDFAATACIIFESLTKMMHLSFSTLLSVPLCLCGGSSAILLRLVVEEGDDLVVGDLGE